MRQFAAISLITAIVFLAGCGPDTPERLIKDGINCMNELASILEGVTDEASAKAAAPKIDALAARMADLQKRHEALPKMDPAAQEALEKKYDKENSQAMDRIYAAAGKLAANPAATQAIKASLDKLWLPK